MATAKELAAFAAMTNYAIPTVDYHVGVSAGVMFKSFKTLPAWGTGSPVMYAASSNTIYVKASNVTLDGYDFTGASVIVMGNNVTIKNSKFDTAASWYSLSQAKGYSGLVVENSSFDGLKMNKNVGFINSGEGRMELRYNEFKNAPGDSLSITNGIVDHNYFSGAGYLAGAHADAIWVPKTTGAVTITNNFIDYRAQSDALAMPNNAIRILPELGDVHNVTVSKNVLLGGTYTVNVTSSPYTAYKIDSVKVTDNFVAAGQYADLYPGLKPADLDYQGNSASQISAYIGPAQQKLAGISITGAKAAAVSIQGTAGGDCISANGTYNVIDGNGGRDVIFAGAGVDIFVYDAINDSSISLPDYICNFKSGVDKINLHALANNAYLETGALKLIGAAAFSGAAGEIRTTQVASGTTTLTRVDIDLNGDRYADMRIDLTGAPKLSALDFLL